MIPMMFFKVGSIYLYRECNSTQQITLFKTRNMETNNGYKTSFEQKKERMDLRMDKSMIQQLKGIRRRTGISVSELIREAVRRLLQEFEETNNLKLNG